MEKSLIGWISVGCIVVVLILVGVFQDYLGARVLSVKGGRASVRQGEVVSLQLPKTTVAFVKIELCQEGKTPEKCVLILSKAPVKTQNITIPKNAVLGRAVIKATERNAKGAVTTNVLMRRAVQVVKAKPTPAPKEESGGGGGSGSSGGGGGGSDSGPQPSEPVVSYNITHLCYEGDQTLHASWKPAKNFLRFRKSGESAWLPNLSDCSINGCKDVREWTYPDYKTAIFYISSNNPMPPNTDFEFQFAPYYSSPDGSSENSQVYRYNSGALPAPGVCRSLL